MDQVWTRPTLAIAGAGGLPVLTACGRPARKWFHDLLDCLPCRELRIRGTRNELMGLFDKLLRRKHQGGFHEAMLAASGKPNHSGSG